MIELWTVPQIAQHYDCDPSTVRYWTTQQWFPGPFARASDMDLYDPAAVKRARRGYLKRKRGNA